VVSHQREAQGRLLRQSGIEIAASQCHLGLSQADSSAPRSRMPAVPPVCSRSCR
jgi:hypothetical protein